MFSRSTYPDWDEIHIDEERPADADSEENRRGDGALGGDADGHGSVILEVDLESDKTDDGEAEENEQGNDAAVTPFVDDTTPLEGEQEADDGGHEDGSAERVEVLESNPERLLLALRLLLKLEEGEKTNGRHGTNWKVDVETPSPCELLGEGSSHQRSSDRGNAVHRTNETKEGGAPLDAHGMGENDEGTGKDTSTSHTGNSASDNERHGCWRKSTNQGSDLEDAEGSEKDPFNVEHGVELSEQELERTGCQEVGGTVPADVVEVVELICDARDGYGDNLEKDLVRGQTRFLWES